MRARRRLLLALLGAGMVAATSAAPLLAQEPKGGGEAPVTLSLAVWDQPGRQAEQAALDLVALAPELSGGAITVAEPLWGMGDAASLVRSGEVDLAILATREWSPLGVTSLDALEAPFLIDDDALAIAVATSDVVDAAMAGLTDLGVTGLAMWPEDLRHLFAFEPFGHAFTTPEDISGATILGIAGEPGRELITSLGGMLYEEGVETATQSGDRVQDSKSGALDGMVTGLWGAGLATDQIDGSFVAGDIVLYPKFQVLAANSESLARLSDEQRAALDGIVAEVRSRALERHFSEADLAAGICERGGAVIEAGPEAIADLKAAAQPLADSMATDPVMGDVMARVRDLATQTGRTAGAGTCVPEGRVAARSPAPVTVELELTGYSGRELLPDGTYRAEASADDLVAAGADEFYAAINAGTWTLSVEGDEWQAEHQGRNEVCSGSHEIVGENVRLLTVVSKGCGMDYDVRWRLDGDALSLRLADLPHSHTAADFANEQTFMDRVWTRIDGPIVSSAPAAFVPPSGAYRTESTVEELEATGMNHRDAVRNAGILTWILQDGVSTIRWETGADPGSECRPSYAPFGPVVRVVFDGSDGCDVGTYELTFELDGDELLPTVISSDPPRDLEPSRAFFERPWTRIADGASGGSSPKYPVSDSAGFDAALPPDGTYRADVSRDDLITKGVPAEWATDNSGVFTFSFDDGVYVFDYPSEPPCEGTYETLDSSVLLRGKPGGCAPTMNIMWRPETDGISILLAVPTEGDWSPIDFTNIQAHLEGRTWTKID